MHMIMTPDESKMQLFVDRSTSHANRVYVNNRQSPEFHVVVVIIGIAEGIKNHARKFGVSAIALRPLTKCGVIKLV